MKKLKTRAQLYDQLRRGALMIVAAIIGLFELANETPPESKRKADDEGERPSLGEG